MILNFFFPHPFLSFLLLPPASPQPQQRHKPLPRMSGDVMRPRLLPALCVCVCVLAPGPFNCGLRKNKNSTTRDESANTGRQLGFRCMWRSERTGWGNSYVFLYFAVETQPTVSNAWPLCTTHSFFTESYILTHSLHCVGSWPTSDPSTPDVFVCFCMCFINMLLFHTKYKQILYFQ